MEDRAQYGKIPKDRFTVYKFEVNPVNPEISRVYSWKNLTSIAAHKLIPSNYKLCDESIIKSQDYYLVVYMKSYADNICYYYLKDDKQT
jgi:hypothetical protein